MADFMEILKLMNQQKGVQGDATLPVTKEKTPPGGLKGVGLKAMATLGRITSLPVSIGGAILGGDSAKAAMGYDAETRAFRDYAWGINGNKGVPGVPKKEVVAETVAPANVVTPAAVVTPEKNVDQYNGDIYTALRDPNGLSDKQFKAFVDTHGGSLPGIGYVEDPKTGKITRVAEKPSAPEMTIDQADAQARMITANAHKLAGVEAGKERKAIADDKIAAQKRDQFAKALAISSPKETDPTTGIVTGVNEEVGLFDLVNRKHPIHDDYKPAVEALNEKYKSFEAAVYSLPKNKGKKPNKAQVDSMFRQGLLERKI